MATVLDLTKPQVLETEEEQELAIAEIEELVDQDPPPGTDAYRRLEFLSVLAEAYEREHYPVEEAATSPQQLVEFMLEQKGMDRTDLYDAMGGKARVSEFFSGKRSLWMNQVIVLRELLGIPADLLIRGE